jgi:long-subunit acyl-CoA synthetase (AMP-forming)
LGSQAAEYIVNHAEITTLCVSLFRFKRAIELIAEFSTVRTMIVMGDKIPDHPEVKVQLVSAQKVLDDGVNSDGYDEPDLPDPKNVALIMYTSGSTGTP